MEIIAAQFSELMADHQGNHSALQMDSFITARAGGTLYGCYKQALREIDTRIHALRSHYYERAKLPAQIRRLKKRNTEEAVIRASFLNMRIGDVASHIADSEREFIRFYAQAIAIRSEMESAGEIFPLSEEARHRLDCEMWEHRLKTMAAGDLIAEGRIARVTIEFLVSTPREIRARLAAAFEPANRDNLVGWFLNHEVPIPDGGKIDAITQEAVLKCLESSNSPKPSRLTSRTDSRMLTPAN